MILLPGAGTLQLNIVFAEAHEYVYFLYWQKYVNVSIYLTIDACSEFKNLMPSTYLLMPITPGGAQAINDPLPSHSVLGCSGHSGPVGPLLFQLCFSVSPYLTNDACSEFKNLMPSNWTQILLCRKSAMEED